MNIHLFATDIDAKTLSDAGKAVYPETSVENIRHRLLTKYFTPEGKYFRLSPEIKEMVTLSLYDVLDKKHGVPPESVFGNFDLVLCRNMLIYFNTKYQELIFEKLYHSLAGHGYLILGEAESPTLTHQQHFGRVFDFSPIYRKR
jgi:chemotaxis methyl-accepting protein methylase